MLRTFTKKDIRLLGKGFLFVFIFHYNGAFGSSVKFKSAVFALNGGKLVPNSLLPLRGPQLIIVATKLLPLVLSRN